MENIKEMNRLIIIGNGFDLAHGMKTTYEDFMASYLSNLINNEKFKCKHDLMNKITYLALTSNKNYTFKEAVSLIEKWKMIETDKLSQFVLNILKTKTDKEWIDIEKAYYKFLTAEFTKKPIRYDPISILNTDLKKLKNLLQDYLMTIENPTIIKKLNKIFHDILDSRNLEKYTLIEDHYPQISLFLNFNYTNTIKQYFDSYALGKILVNIHGQLNDSKNPVIFGYGDEMDKNYELIEEKNDNDYLKNFKTFQYSKTSNYQNLERFVESLPFEVFIIGHSCGLSDRVLLNYVFEHENCKSIKVYYYKDEENYLNTVKDISRHFKDKQLVRSKVVPFDQSEPCPQWDDEEQ